MLLGGCNGNGAVPTVAAPGLGLTPVFSALSFHQPVLMVPAPDGTEWFLVQRTGEIYRFVAHPDASSAVLFADLSDRINAGPSEAGLLGMAFHPDYPRNRLVYLSYTRGSLESVVSAFRVGSEGVLDVDTEQEVLTLDQPYGNHNGGHIAFGPDGMLHIGFGDGGAGGDPGNRAQDLGNWFGAMLRIDISVLPYRVPPDNPFVGRQGVRPEIFAYGLRNPWRWSFDRETGELWAGDVGQNAVEEIDIIRAGGNYGWRCYEGSEPFDLSGCPPPSELEFPVAEYPNPEEGRSVIGGYVYRGQAIPELQGVYVFGDFVSGRIWGLFPDGGGGYERRLLIDSGLRISSFAEGADGALYVLDYSGGKVYRIVEQ